MPRKDPDARRAYDRWRGRKRKAEGYKPPALRAIVERVNTLKSTTPCADCGKLFPPICMDFDHLIGKTTHVSQMVYGGYSWEDVRKEIGKCELVCACCHRIRTSLRPYRRRK